MKKQENRKKWEQEKKNKTESYADNSREVYRIMFLFAGLFLLLCGYLCYFLIFESREVINNPYNLRQETFERRIVRGKILSSEGEILAETQVTEDGGEVRFYPYKEMFAHVVGYSQNGKTGLEQKYNFDLLTSDVPFYEKLYKEFTDTKCPGNQIVTTLSVNLQQAAYEAIGDYKGAVVVMEPSTGKVLAMVSKPGFDPNTIVDDWEMLINSDSSDGVLLNRATQGLYSPGSTFKILTALEYMREYPEALENFSYECNGIFSYHNAEINCYHGKAHGNLKFKDAFAKSCNGAFARIGSMLSIPDLYTLCESFLFNKELVFPLAYNQSSFLLSEEAEPWELVQTVIGQGKTVVSPLHNALITAAVANGGVLMEPCLVSEIQNAYGKQVKQYLPTIYKRLMTPEESAALTELMSVCVTEGTGYAVLSDSYTAAGKTGTAEWEEGKEAHSWFVGFAPAEKPRLVVSVVMEEAGTGSEYAAPVAKKIFDAYFNKNSPEYRESQK